MLSIIIPTLNEEDYLPLLLNSIKKQNFKEDLEIIVADADSRDETIKIARSFGCKVVSGGLPARGRNEGAKIAKGEWLLFLDADVILPKNFLEKLLTEAKKRKLDVASLMLEPQTEKKMIKFLIECFYNIPIKKIEKILPFGAMGILVKKAVHQTIGGFNERIKIAEDHDYVKRAAKVGNFGVLRDVRISISLRRFYQDGWLRTGIVYLLAGIYYNFGGTIKSDIFKYKFGHYTKTKK